MQSSSAALKLRQSLLYTYLAIFIFIIVFLLLATQLYLNSAASRLKLAGTNELISNIRDLRVKLSQLETTAARYTTTGNEANHRQYHKLRAETELLLSVMANAVSGDASASAQLDAVRNNFLNQTDELNRAPIGDPGRTSDHLLQEMEKAQMEQLNYLNNDFTDSSQLRYLLTASSFLCIALLLGITFYRIRKRIEAYTLAEEVAKNKEARYRLLVENAGVTTLLVDQNRVIRFVSRNVSELCGYTAEELIGTPFSNKISGEHRAAVLQALMGADHAANYNTTLEMQVVTAGGELRWVSCRIFPAGQTSNGFEWQVVLWDIEDEKQRQLEFEALEAEHKNQLRLVQDIINNIPSVLYIKDRDGTYLMVNRKTEEVFNLPAGEIIGKTTAELYRDSTDRIAVYHATDREVIDGGHMVELEETVTSHNRLQYFWITKFPLFDGDGQVKYIGVIAADITERKETELKLIESRQEAEQARRAQEAFLANMSHEIRTPMNGIIGMTNLLSGTALNEEQKDFTESIRESAASLLGIINDLLDFSKIKSGKFEFEAIPFEPRSSIRKAIYPLQFRADEKRVRLNLGIDGSVPRILIGDPLRLQQIVINLTSNAIKFTSKGSVDIFLSCESVNGEQVRLQVSVKDSGIGIPADKLDRIFEAFAQSKAEDARKYGGTGLGLAIVKQLVELQSGTIKVLSTVGRGSVFSFSIPYGIGKDIRSSEDLPDAATRLNQLQGIRILAAEDNLINQKVVLNTLVKQGAHVTIVNNGQEAIQQIKQGGFDLILMDLQMPEVDGYKATRYIRKVMKSDIPIIAMTADALKGEEAKCFEAGMNGYISKPFEPHVLFNLILSLAGIQVAHPYDPARKRSAQDLVDFSFLEEISDSSSEYMHEVLDIFLNTMPSGLEKLRKLVEETEDFDSIARQAHFLKSSVGVVKVGDMYSQLADIETAARNHRGLEEIRGSVRAIMDLYQEAQPLVLKERERHRQAGSTP